MADWQSFSVMELPPEAFVLVYVSFDDPGAQARIRMAYWSAMDGFWRTSSGRLRGTVTHWMLLPAPPMFAQGDDA